MHIFLVMATSRMLRLGTSITTRLKTLFISFLITSLVVWVRLFLVGPVFPKAVHMESIETPILQNVPSRGIVLCVHDAESIRRAWTQIKSLRKLYSMHRVAFTVYHAGELSADSEAVHQGIRRLKALPYVDVQSLGHWVSAAYGNEEGIERFQSVFCKTGALLAAPHDVVALVDLDVVLTANPLSLVNTSIFRETGSYLFRDRRISADNMYRQQSLADYRDRLKELWRQFHPEDPDNISTAMANTPPFTGWSYDHGESAVVVLDKRRHTKALLVLRGMVGPEWFYIASKGVHGDKELYWQALALAGETPGMNPLACADVGTRNDQGGTCCYQWTNAQWMWVDGEQPRVFYVNGDGVERMIEGSDNALFDAFVSDPLNYFSNQTHIDDMPCCNRGANRLPLYVTTSFHAYRLVYDSYASYRA